MDFKNLGKKSLEVILSAALGVSAIAGIAKAEDRFYCFADTQKTMSDNSSKGPCNLKYSSPITLNELRKAVRKIKPDISADKLKDTTYMRINHFYTQLSGVDSKGSKLYSYENFAKPEFGNLLRIPREMSFRLTEGTEQVSPMLELNLGARPADPQIIGNMVKDIKDKNQYLIIAGVEGNSIATAYLSKDNKGTNAKELGEITLGSPIQSAQSAPKVITVETIKVAPEVLKAQKEAAKKPAIVKSTNSYVNDLNEAAELLDSKEDRWSYGDCKKADRILANGIFELRNSTAPANVDMLSKFEKAKSNEDLRGCMEQYRKDKLARYAERGAMLGAGIESGSLKNMPVASLGYKWNGKAIIATYGQSSKKSDPVTTTNQGAADALGFSRRVDHYIEEENKATRQGIEAAFDVGLNGIFSAGYVQETIKSEQVGLDTLGLYRNNVLRDSQQRPTEGDDNAKISYVKVGAGYKVSSNTDINVYGMYPLGSKKVNEGTRLEKTYGDKIKCGMNINYRFGNGSKSKGYFQRKVPGK